MGQSNNKRIARNTLFMYFRMFLVLTISFFSGRIVLNTLGIVDYGINNIINGTISLFSFLNISLTNAGQRYLSIAVANNDKEDTQKVFSTLIVAQFLIIAVFFVASETIGLWFVYNKLSLPPERFDAAVIVYHLSIITTCVNILKIPYNAAIIANEKMDFYAYTSIVESILKLAIIYMLVIFDFDKLILYAILHLLVSLILFFWYKIYSNSKFSGYKFSISYNKEYFGKIISFSGWNLVGSVADLGYKQGTNIILNLFHGVKLNAAMGIYQLVISNLFQFVSSLYISANPQIIKLYHQRDLNAFWLLVCRISKFAFFLMLLIAVPLAINLSYVLDIWLINPPRYTYEFMFLGLVFTLIDCLHGPLWTSIQATGNIRLYQVVTSLILLLNIPFAYFLLFFGFMPYSILVVQIILSVLTLVIRVAFTIKQTNMPFKYYIMKVLFPIFKVLTFSLPLPVMVTIVLNNDGFVRMVVTSVVSLICILASIYFCGLDVSERTKALEMAKAKLHISNPK